MKLQSLRQVKAKLKVFFQHCYISMILVLPFLSNLNLMDMRGGEGKWQKVKEG